MAEANPRNGFRGMERGEYRPSCPVCGESRWDRGPQTMALLQMKDDGQIDAGGPWSPVSVVSCRRCDYLMLFIAPQD